MLRCFLGGGASALALLSFTGTACAQTAEVAVDSDGAAKATIEEIVVTAQRRVESLKDVPISVQAISGEQLSKQAIVDTRDLATIAPTINFSAGNSASGTAFSLRGVTSVAVQNGIQPSTAMIVDGVVLSRQAEFIANLADIDRIEVLNGPQGTLFGKNSTAGVINIVTRKPTDEFEGMIDGLVTNDSEYGVHLLINAPLGTQARVRMNAFYRDQRPLIDNLTGPDILGNKSYGGNVKLDLDLGEDVDLLLAGTYSHSNSSSGQFLPLQPSIFGAFHQAVNGAAPIRRGATTINTDEPSIDIYASWNSSATLNWHISDGLALTSISNYSKFKEDSSIDPDTTPVGIIIGKGESTPGTGYPFEAIYVGLKNRFPDRFHYLSQEVRLSYNAAPLNAVFGVYYQDYHDAYSLNIPVLIDGSILGLTPGTPYYNAQIPTAKIRDRTASIFGDITAALSDRLKVFGGLRYTREKINVDYHRDEFFGPASLLNTMTGNFGAPPTLTVDTKADDVTYNLSGRGGIAFEPTRNMNFYASYARGYKTAAVDVGQTLLPGVNPIIKPEIATAYEVGAKLRLFDNRVAINIALFHQKISDIQEGVIQPGLVYSPILINAGALKTRGVEADAQWAVTPELRLNFAVAYNKSTYSGFSYRCTSTQDDTGTCPNDPTAGFQNITGQPAIGSPAWKYSAAAYYGNKFGGSDLSYYLQVNWTWTGAIFYELGADPLSREPSHGMLNASVGLKGPDDRWEVQLFGKNLTNDLYYGNLMNLTLIGRPVGYLSRDFQAYGGVKLSYRF